MKLSKAYCVLVCERRGREAPISVTRNFGGCICKIISTGRRTFVFLSSLSPAGTHAKAQSVTIARFGRAHAAASHRKRNIQNNGFGWFSKPRNVQRVRITRYKLPWPPVLSRRLSWPSLHLSSYSTIDWFPLLRPASPVSGGVGNLIYEWRFW
jgi:hypothetical protein